MMCQLQIARLFHQATMTTILFEHTTNMLESLGFVTRVKSFTDFADSSLNNTATNNPLFVC